MKKKNKTEKWKCVFWIFFVLVTPPVIYASRYSVPQQSIEGPSCEGPEQNTQKGANLRGVPSSSTEDLPNAERKDRYMLRDILVEDLEIETREAADDLFAELCIRPAILVSKNSITENQSCGDAQPVMDLREHSDLGAHLSGGPQTQGRNAELLEKHSCTVRETSTVNKSNSKERLKTFFKMTL